MFRTEEGARRCAHELKRALNLAGHEEVKLATCLEAIARRTGYSDWHEACQRLKSSQQIDTRLNRQEVIPEMVSRWVAGGDVNPIKVEMQSILSAKKQTNEPVTINSLLSRRKGLVPLGQFGSEFDDIAVYFEDGTLLITGALDQSHKLLNLQSVLQNSGREIKREHIVPLETIRKIKEIFALGVTSQDRKTNLPGLDLDRHVFVSGAAGSGKSTLGMQIIEFLLSFARSKVVLASPYARGMAEFNKMKSTGLVQLEVLATPEQDLSYPQDRQASLNRLFEVIDANKASLIFCDEVDRILYDGPDRMDVLDKLFQIGRAHV